MLHWAWVWFCPVCSSPRCCWPCGFRWQPGLVWAPRASRPGPASVHVTGESPGFYGSPSTQCRSAHPGWDWPRWDLQGEADQEKTDGLKEVCTYWNWKDSWVAVCKLGHHCRLWMVSESRIILQSKSAAAGKDATCKNSLGASQSTHRLLPLALRMACSATASLWLLLRAWINTTEKHKLTQTRCTHTHTFESFIYVHIITHIPRTNGI